MAISSGHNATADGSMHCQMLTWAYLYEGLQTNEIEYVKLRDCGIESILGDIPNRR